MDPTSEDLPDSPREATALGPHLDEDTLADHASGEPLTAAQHLHVEVCRVCRAEVEQWVRVAEQVRAAAAVEMVEPPDHLWGQIASAVDLKQPAEARGAGRRALLSALAGLLAGVLLGAAALLGFQRIAGSTGADVDPVRQAQLLTLDRSADRGIAKLVRTGSGLALDVTTSPMDAGSGYLEVWLINIDGVKMVSVGILPEGTFHAVFPVSQKMIDDGYLLVDVSREQLDEKPQHSGDSLARGQLTS